MGTGASSIGTRISRPASTVISTLDSGRRFSSRPKACGIRSARLFPHRCTRARISATSHVDTLSIHYPVRRTGRGQSSCLSPAGGSLAAHRHPGSGVQLYTQAPCVVVEETTLGSMRSTAPPAPCRSLVLRSTCVASIWIDVTESRVCANVASPALPFGASKAGTQAHGLDTASDAR